MGYVLRYLDGRPRSQLSEQQLTEAASALLFWHVLSDFEEGYVLLFENFVELEETIAAMAAKFLARGFGGHQWLHDNRRLIDRRLMNFLTTCRSYLDRGGNLADSMFDGLPGARERFYEVRSKQYDSLLGYRVMEAMRNYTQHFGHPIESISFGLKNDEADHPPLKKYHISFHLKPLTLAEDKKFKKAILTELQQLGEKVDLRPLVREYVDGLSEIHACARELLKPKIEASKTTLQSLLSDDLQSDKRDIHLNFCQVFEEMANGEEQHLGDVFPELLTNYDHLVERGPTPKTLSRSYVSFKIE